MISLIDCTGHIHPEEQELELKQAELNQLEEELAQRELEFALLFQDIESFQKEYAERLGASLAELADWEARLQEALAASRPNDEELQESAGKARRNAEEARRTVEDSHKDGDKEHKPITDHLKSLYRQAAKKMHPDLAVNEEDRVARTRIMVEINAAFAAGDTTRIERMLKEWILRPEAVPGEGIAAELVRIIRKIAQVKERLDEIRININDLSRSEWNELRLKCDTCIGHRHKFFEKMEQEIHSRIGNVTAKLNRFTRTK